MTIGRRDPSSSEAVRERSGSVDSDDRLAHFLYLLMRDVIPPGVVEEVERRCSGGAVSFTNGWLARHALDLAARLRLDPSAPADAPPPNLLSPDPAMTAEPNDRRDPPLTVDFLISALESQLRMHDFMAATDRGGKAERAYIDGLRESSAYLLRRLRAEGVAPPPDGITKDPGR